MSQIIQFSEVEGKIMSFELLGVFKVLHVVSWGQFNISNTWLTSATPIFDFQLFSNFIFSYQNLLDNLLKESEGILVKSVIPSNSFSKLHSKFW